jgi:IMP dehydrogenase
MKTLNSINKFYSNEVALTYDDVQLVPVDRSEIKSRNDVKLDCKLSVWGNGEDLLLKIPLLTAPMDTVTNKAMSQAVGKLGGLGFIHRYQPVEERIRQTFGVDSPVGIAIGLEDSFEEDIENIVCRSRVLLLDVANGHSKYVIEHVEKLRNYLDSHGHDDVIIVCGNVATKYAFKDLITAGASAVRVSIGGGSCCSTRIVTGFGVPNLTAIMECRDLLEGQTWSNHVQIIADGGVRNSGDASKAIAGGAHLIMVGSLLAGTEEAPGNLVLQESGLYKEFRGMASLDSQVGWKGMKPGTAPEGVSTLIPFKGSVVPVIEEFVGGLKSALSYGGATNLQEFYENTRFVRVTNAGIAEAKPHIKG